MREVPKRSKAEATSHFFFPTELLESRCPAFTVRRQGKANIDEENEIDIRRINACHIQEELY